MRNEASTVGARRSVAAGAVLVVAAGLIAGGCSSGSSSGSSALACPSKHGTAVTGTAPAATGRPAAGWTQPDADLAATRDVASAITSANVSKLGVAWTVPLTISTAHTSGAYATTPVIVNGVVYAQDLDSNVYAISLATGKVLWTHDYDSPNGGPDGVNVADGVVYAATNHAEAPRHRGRITWPGPTWHSPRSSLTRTPGPTTRDQWRKSTHRERQTTR